MSVDTLRENFHINRISVKDLQDFLTAQTYRPEITDVKHKILALNHVSLQSVCSKPIRQGKSPKYTENTGLICIKPRNTNSMLVSAEEVDWIEPSTKAEIQNQKLVYGDVVITRSGSGTIGRASVYPYAEEAYVNDHLFIVRPSSADSHYVCSYLKSYFGERLLESGISGSTGQLNLSNEHIKAVPLFFPKPDAQKYIGEKVRQAERLRAWAKGTMSDITLYFDSLFPQVTYEASYASIKSSALSDRLDSVFYQKHYLELDEFFDDCGEQVSLLSSFVEKSISGPAIPSEEFGDSGVAVLQTKDIKENLVDIEGCGKISAKLALEYERFEVSENHILMGMSGTIGRSALIYNDKNKFIINQRVAGLSINNDDIAGYLCAYLNHEFGKQQLQRRSVGGVQANIGLSEILATRVLIKDEIEAISISSKYVVALTAIEFACQLTKSAKLLVEDLIEGQVTESQLVSAQQALDEGDDSLDRALLERMTVEGIDADSEPLFDDIDQLYDLLEQAKQELDADDTMAEA
ncbi:restriction endonuclease subunit S [Vibrio lentus]|uniref:restriction endonuclease subunit S n=1 Tax=Vibrio lentus TaxID=136468 RepID=UPI000C84688D|nr:restriction endonuclease subunit S [Vibrio lentus]PMJ60451.1 hypothetical protein BCU18_07040 [Vibrio lentus]